MLGQRRRRWPSIKPTLCQCLVHVGTADHSHNTVDVVIFEYLDIRVLVVIYIVSRPFFKQGNDLGCFPSNVFQVAFMKPFTCNNKLRELSLNVKIKRHDIVLIIG